MKYIYFTAVVVLLTVFTGMTIKVMNERKYIYIENFHNLNNNEECTVSRLSPERHLETRLLRDDDLDGFVAFLEEILENHIEMIRDDRLAAMFDYEASFNKFDQVRFLYQETDKGYLDYNFKHGIEGTVVVDPEGAKQLKDYFETIFSNADSIKKTD